MPRVLISDKLEAPGLDLLRQAGLKWDERPGLKGDELREALRAADGVIIRSGTTLTADLLEDPGRLRAVVRAGVGVDNIHVAAATRRGIVVMNTPGGNTVSTAEQTITLLMALARQTPAADAHVRQGKWERARFVGTQLAGKTPGVRGPGPLRRGGPPPSRRPGHEGGRLRPVPVPRPGHPPGHRGRGRSGPAPASLRLPDRPLPADRRDPRPDRRPPA